MQPTNHHTIRLENVCMCIIIIYWYFLHELMVAIELSSNKD